MNVPSHHPHGLTGESLDYVDYANAICQILTKLEASNTGLTVGIFGDWGMGKSSVLRMVKETLLRENQDKDRLVIEFDAWRYSQQEELWLALLRKILRGIESHPKARLSLWTLNWSLLKNRLNTNPVFWRNFRSLIFMAIGAIFLLFAAAIVFVVVLAKPADNPLWVFLGGAGAFLAFWAKAVWKTLGNFLRGKIDINLPSLTRPGFDRGQPLVMDDFREDFRTIVQAVGGNTPIVVLIDDLDRCPFDQIVPVLEAIKHFGFDDVDESQYTRQDGAPIAFVLAADRRAIEQAVAGYYKNFREQMLADEAKRFPREYVEKVVQIPFELPPLTRIHLERLLIHSHVS